MNNIIRKVEIQGLWDIYNVNWNTVNPDVNILVGINGSGKSTILNAMYSCLNDPKNVTNDFFLNKIAISFDDYTIDNINGIQENFKAPYSVKLNRDDNSFEPILKSLKQVVEEKTAISKEEFDTFIKIINRLFMSTKKRLDESDLSTIKFLDINNKEVALHKLSLGEKQMLTFLYKVFLTRKQPYALFLDEPEYSLHIEWQEQLIDIIRQINPNSQLFITTHSPSIFSSGWQDKLQFIEDFTTAI